MFGLNLFPTKEGSERIDIYYTKMTPMLKQIVSLVKNEKPVLYGMLEGEKYLLDLKDIGYIDTVDRRTFAYTDGQVYQLSGSLAALEEQLGAFGFVRISKANLVNVFWIRAVKPEANMRVLAVLKNGERLQINRSYKRTFEDFLKQVNQTL